MNKKMYLGILVLILMAQSLAGCCNRCKTADAGYTGTPTAAVSGGPSYVGSSAGSSEARQAIK